MSSAEFDAGEGDGYVAGGDRPVETAQHIAGALGFGADDYPVGLQEITDRRPFAQEFRIGGDIERNTRTAAGNLVHQPARRSHRNRQLGDDDLVAIERGSDFVGGLVNESEVGGIIATPRRRADGNHHHIRTGNSRGQLGGKAQAADIAIGAHHVLEPGLVNRHSTLLQLKDAVDVVVDAGHVIAELGKAGARYQSHVTGADDGNFHDTISQGRRREALHTGRWMRH